MELTKEMLDRAYAAVQKDRVIRDNEYLDYTTIYGAAMEAAAATMAERERWLCAIRWCKEQYDVRVYQQSLTPCQVLDRLRIAFHDERGGK
jgi:hypothetical protein